MDHLSLDDRDLVHAYVAQMRGPLELGDSERVDALLDEALAELSPAAMAVLEDLLG